jgi:hypothetical protein
MGNQSNQSNQSNQDELVVEIEVGGDHGDGNVEVIRKSKGVRVIIRDFDNSYIPEEAGEGAEPVPQEREWSVNSEC